MTHIRLAPEKPTSVLSFDEARDSARDAFGDARVALAQAQTRLAYLSVMVFDDKTVTYTRLKGMRSETREVIQRAFAVEAALTRSIEAMEAAK